MASGTPSLQTDMSTDGIRPPAPLQMNSPKMWFARLIRRPTLLTLLGIQSIFLVIFIHTGEIFPSASPKAYLPDLVLGYVSLGVLSEILTAFTPKLPVLRAVIPIYFCLGYALLCFYHLSTTASFHFATVADHFRSLFHHQAVTMVFARFSPGACGAFLALSVLLLAVELWRKPFAREVNAKARTKRSVLLVIGYAMAVILWQTPHDEVSYFLRSVGTYYFMSLRVDAEAENAFRVNPGFHPDRRDGAVPPLPHIFILFVESFNAVFVEARASNGLEFTPFFNSQLREGLFLEHFYANATYTVKGEEAALCSLYPSLRGDIATQHARAPVRGLPGILRGAGYTSVFMHALPDLSFANTGDFMRRLGFDLVQSMDNETLTPAEQKSVWGWGLEDSSFYRKAFELLDRHTAKVAAPGREPRLFVVLASASSHAPYRVPQRLRLIYEVPASMAEHYGNAIRFADLSLEVFFTELAKRPYLSDSLVCILGDHSAPIGQHGFFSTESKFYEECFRIPLLMIWPGHLAPCRVKGTFSQVDLAPTLMDLLKIDHPNEFVGRSVFASDKGGPQLLVQNSGGRYLIAIEYPYKYVLHLETNKEYFFDLSQDPLERRNLILLKNPHAKRLHAEIFKLFVHQRLLERRGLR